MNSILRWAGSKKKLLNELRELSPRSFNNYLEPFAGSAVLFFDLLPTQGVLGDLNPEVIATYSAIRDTPQEVILFLQSIPKTKEAYCILRSINPELLSQAQRAARLIYLMKACFNGVYRTNLKGIFNVPLGNKFFALPTPDMISAVSESLQGMELVCGDFLKTVAYAKSGDFIYLDPPYSDGTRFRGEYSYSGAFQKEDQLRLIHTCRDLNQLGVQVLLSFKECDSIIDGLHGWSFKHIDVSRSIAGFARSRRNAREILAHNYKLD
ncbi:DNA adenine methylase [Achromobacter xylosoxidans]